MHKLIMIIEKADDGFLGRVEFHDNLIVEEADTVNGLESIIKRVLFDFHELQPEDIIFERLYDLTALFEQFKFLKISTIAEMAGVNPSLLRQYVTGVKHPSATQALRIEEILHRIGNDLVNVHVSA